MEIIDHQHECVMEKYKLNQIGIKTNTMLPYQAAEALSTSLVLRPLLLGCVWTEPSINFFTHLAALELVLGWFNAWTEIVAACPRLLQVLGICFPTLKDILSIISSCLKVCHLYCHYFNIYVWVFVKYVRSLPSHELHNLRPVVPKLCRNSRGTFRVLMPVSPPHQLPSPKDYGMWPVLLFFIFLKDSPGDLMCSK